MVSIWKRGRYRKAAKPAARPRSSDLVSLQNRTKESSCPVPRKNPSAISATVLIIGFGIGNRKVAIASPIVLEYMGLVVLKFEIHRLVRTTDATITMLNIAKVGRNVEVDVRIVGRRVKEKT